MNPLSKETPGPGLNLPPPVVGEQLPVSNSPEAQPETAGRPAAAERAPSSAAAGATAAQPAVPLPPITDTPAPLLQNDVTSTSQSAGSSLIKDDDLIEKKWVDKAKRIVEHTRDDPHQQSEQLTLVKADYMKQRYQKTIKVSK